MPESSRTLIRWCACLLATATLLAVAVRLAWLGDDAYITLRSVENWVRGHGLRWNPQERVQTYTHPLWMLVLTLGRLATGEAYFATIGVSLLLSTVAVAALVWRAATAAGIAAVACLLLTTRAFVDYMTSGLETPLSYLLLVLLVAGATRPAGDADSSRRRFARTATLAALLATNRMDLALLAAPATLATMQGLTWCMIARVGLLASLPLVAWLAFACVYYGSPFPVTAHAKAFDTGIPLSALVTQGIHYLQHAAMQDPVLLATAMLGPIALLWQPRWRWLALGSLLYVAYVVKVGGSFMQGRLLLPPFVVTTACLATSWSRLHWRVPATLAAAAVALSCIAGLPGWLQSPQDDQPLAQERIDAQHGIVDERLMYYRGLGLLSDGRRPARYGALEAEIFADGRADRWLLLHSLAGQIGYQAGPNGHIVDQLLCDPLLARLPASNPASWRIGHVKRRIPEGYWESLRSGQNQIHHPGLRRYYDALRAITRAPVWSTERLRALWQMAIGSRDEDLRAFVAEDYHQPPRVSIEAGELRQVPTIGGFWFDEPQARVVYEGGLAVRFATSVDARSIDLHTLGLGTFRCRFRHAGSVIGEAISTPQPQPPGLTGLRATMGVRREVLQVPDTVQAFDTLWIDFVPLVDPGSAAGPPCLCSVRASS